jgi:peptidyl-prolyl cis-trans isomerase SDCCAG10
MATASVNDNTSQFFITLGATPELQNKHTLFGRVAGDTVFNVLKMNDLELNEERPVKPPKIIGAKVLDNFFNDIIPRTASVEKRAIREAEEKQRAALEAEKKRPKKGVK